MKVFQREISTDNVIAYMKALNDKEYVETKKNEKGFYKPILEGESEESGRVYQQL